MNDSRTRLFGSSGIRGLANQEIGPELGLRVGLAISALFPRETVYVGRDTRLSGDMISSSIISGLLSGGCRVVELGVLPTPALAYITKVSGAPCGIMITASHNPAEFNGIKLFGSDSSAYGESLQAQVEKIIGDSAFPREDWQNLHNSSFVDESSKYVAMVVNEVKLQRRWRIAVDPCNGAASILGPKIMRELGCNVFSSNAQPDGLFFGRSPEPSANSLRFLGSVVLAHGCDIGIAYDGDADRIAVMDENGRYISQDAALAAFVGYLAARSGGGIFVLSVDASLAVRESIEKGGGTVVWTRVGDVYIAEMIKERKAIFGGEPSGAWIHPSFHLCPDGILSGALLLRAIEESGQTPSSFFSQLRSYPMRREKISCPNNLKVEAIERCASQFGEAIGEEYEITRLDGFRFSSKDAWVLIRASGTEPTIRITAEAKTAESLDRLFETAVDICREIIGEISS